MPAIHTLDAWRDPEREVRVALERWLATEPVSGQFIERPKSLRIVWNYLRRIGPRAVIRKIRSRGAEQRRNRKVIGVGVGQVVDAPRDSGLAAGSRVVFLAPNHGGDWTSLVTDARLAVPISSNGRPAQAAEHRLSPSMRKLAGWSAFSGAPLDASAVREELERVASALGETPPDRSSARAATERIEAGRAPDGRPSAGIFGLGNYAKTQIIPAARRYLRLAAIHEIDPDQLASAAALGAALDTSPEPRADERFDAWFIAGYHHTHAALAVRALRSGAYAVVEKPLATTCRQLDEVRAALAAAGSNRLFVCFHKRYSRLHELAVADLGVRRGEPVDMHSIVYEIPLPALHWYNWPNSGSRLVSNGCHWLDYFLFVNAFSPVARAEVRPLRGRDLAVVAHLENGAQLTLTITDTGSERLGVRDVIELRAADVTVRTIDATYYEAESTTRLLRKARVNPMDAYAHMYDVICRRVVAGAPGDDPASLASSELTLALEAQLQGRPDPLKSLTEPRGRGERSP